MDVSALAPYSEETLLPGCATALDEEIARAWSDLDELDPIVIETLWDAWRCPARLLPWLAWALSLDLWEPGWSEIDKRSAIARSPYLHRIKGTRLAVELALDLLRTPYAVTEWWETLPRARRGTVAVFVEAGPSEPPGQPLPLGALRARAARLVRVSKPKSRAVSIAIGHLASAPLGVAGGSVVRRTITLQPFVATQNPVESALAVRAGAMTSRAVTIQPFVAAQTPVESALPVRAGAMTSRILTVSPRP